MSFRIRTARADDLSALYEMAKLTGGGFTNLPADKQSLRDKLERSATAFARQDDDRADDLFLLVLENVDTGEVRGTAQIFSHIGLRSPFYSYRISKLTQQSKELGRTFRAEILTLTTELEGSSEVGGLFLHPGERAHGLGMLLARSRYLFIREHRERFADRTIAELRGLIDDAGDAPFWDGLAGRFFGMDFTEADDFNAVHGNQFIADLMPKHPIYVQLLTDTARHAMGHLHPSGRAAMRMLEREGFRHDHYIDIFDGGPTVHAATDSILTIAQARRAAIERIGDCNGERVITATGNLESFVAAWARVDGGTIDADGARALGVTPGRDIWVAPP